MAGLRACIIQHHSAISVSYYKLFFFGYLRLPHVALVFLSEKLLKFYGCCVEIAERFVVVRRWWSIHAFISIASSYQEDVAF